MGYTARLLRDSCTGILPQFSGIIRKNVPEQASISLKPRNLLCIFPFGNGEPYRTRGACDLVLRKGGDMVRLVGITPMRMADVTGLRA